MMTGKFYAAACVAFLALSASSCTKKVAEPQPEPAAVIEKGAEPQPEPVAVVEKVAEPPQPEPVAVENDAESLKKESVAAMTELNEILAGVTDVNSASAARPQIAAIRTRMEKLGARTRILSAAEKAALGDQWMPALGRNMKRLQSNPRVWEVLQPLFRGGGAGEATAPASAAAQA